MRLAITLVTGILLATAGSSLHAQTKPAPAPKTAKKAATKPPKKAPATKPAAQPGSAPAAPEESKVARRDPFESLTSRQEAAARAGANLPPGKAGLQVGTLRLDGIVKAPNGMIAVVTNPQSRTYFLREGDQLYDGRVEKIAMDGVSFHEMGKDAFGKPVERQVNKRIYSSAGEQQ
jgi:type IV pilus assembly protein PilP